MDKQRKTESPLERLERQIIERQLRRKEMEDINQGYHVRKTDTREMLDIEGLLNPATT